MTGKERDILRKVLARSFSPDGMKRAAMGFASGTPARPFIKALAGNAVQNELKSVALLFVQLQQARHEADYDLTKQLTRIQTIKEVSRAEQAFTDWAKVRSTPQAEAFLVALLTQKHTNA